MNINGIRVIKALRLHSNLPIRQAPPIHIDLAAANLTAASLLESNCHVLAHMTPPTVFKLWPLYGTPLFPSTSRLSHIITIYHIYIITIGSNAHSNDLIEASIPRLHQFHTSQQALQSTTSTSRSLY
jgi:hypothetical protein